MAFLLFATYMNKKTFLKRDSHFVYLLKNNHVQQIQFPNHYISMNEGKKWEKICNKIESACNSCFSTQTFGQKKNETQTFLQHHRMQSCQLAGSKSVCIVTTDWLCCSRTGHKSTTATSGQVSPNNGKESYWGILLQLENNRSIIVKMTMIQESQVIITTEFPLCSIFCLSFYLIQTLSIYDKSLLLRP